MRRFGSAGALARAAMVQAYSKPTPYASYVATAEVQIDDGSPKLLLHSGTGAGFCVVSTVGPHPWLRGPQLHRLFLSRTRKKFFGFSLCTLRMPKAPRGGVPAARCGAAAHGRGGSSTTLFGVGRRAAAGVPLPTVGKNGPEAICSGYQTTKRDDPYARAKWGVAGREPQTKKETQIEY